MSLKLLKNKDWNKINKNIIDDQEEENYIKLERWSIQNEDKPVIYTEVENKCIDCLYYSKRNRKCFHKNHLKCKKNNKNNFVEINK